MWLFEMRSVDTHSLGFVFSSSMLASLLQVLDDGGRFFLREKARHFAEHFLREVAYVLVRPVLGFGQREDGGELLGRQAAVLGFSVRFDVASGAGLPLISVSVRSRCHFAGSVL